MSVFKFDELIEVSNNPEFSGVGEPVRFQCCLHDSEVEYIGGAPYCVIKPDGTAGFYCFARKIAPKVKVWYVGNLITGKCWHIPESLANEIIADDT
jgi:hypothetical protein